MPLAPGLRKTVTTLATKFGETVVLKKVVPGVFSTATGVSTPTTTDVTVKAIIEEYDAREVAGLVQEGDLKVLIPAESVVSSGDPTTDWKIQMRGKSHEIVFVQEIQVEGQKLAFTLTARGAP